MEQLKKMSTQQPTFGGVLCGQRVLWLDTQRDEERCGIPLSTLSKVNHDRQTLTYYKLRQFSRRLNISMLELFTQEDAGAQPSVTARRRFSRIEDAIRVSTPNIDY